MSQQTGTRHLEPFLQVADEPWQALFLADDAREDLPRGAVNSLDGWTNDQLLDELLRRNAEDASSLRFEQRRILQAVLLALDCE